MIDYNKLYKKYYKTSLWIIAGLYLIGLLVVQLTQHPSYITMLTISAVYSLIITSVYGGAWKGVASQSPAVLSKFYLVASGLRMLLAFLVLLVYAFVVKERTMILSFAVIFMVFYLVLLAFDTVYFYKVEKNNKINN
ncbi:hypothetical protein [Prevotella fusca]|uniref:ATP synthase subunit I n=1 Tax=Prevotella fusca JCM 17724 TaxID=1236517 RepID=A0ABX7XY14_9BACT|nr:hypothetical protein [Prevotella fusca]QUB85952.1 hypothetical protein J5A51_01420 [Prevotella fusca JCM 17724]